MDIDRELEKLKKTDKSFFDVVDWHIACIEEKDEKKQELYRAIYETKRKTYEQLMEEVYGK